MKVGDKVQVNISNVERYAFGCANCLNGKFGTITQVADPPQNWFLAPANCLVAFDSPAEPWWANQSPVTGFWFSPDDLVVIPDDYLTRNADVRVETPS